MRSGAFSLVEVLVSLAIVAILAAIVLPVFRGAKRRAYAVQSGHNLQQLVAANLAYAAENGCYVPADDQWNNRRWHGARTSGSAAFDPTKGFLSEYLGKSHAVVVCPLFKEMVSGGDSFEDGSGGYGYNSSYIGGTAGGGYDAAGIRISATPIQITHPASTVMFTTSAYAVKKGAGVQEYPFAEPPFWDFGDGPSGMRPSPTVHFRFHGKALVAWCDGHQTLESRQERSVGDNPNGGDAEAEMLGWFGPDDNNGFWNSTQ